MRRDSEREGGDRMDFVEVVDQAIALLRQRGRLTYRTLQLQFQLDDAHLQALTDELIKGQRLATAEDGEVLVWIGNAASSPAIPDLHPLLSGREDSHLPQRPGRGTEAGDRAVCRSQGLHGIAGGPRPG